MLKEYPSAETGYLDVDHNQFVSDVQYVWRKEGALHHVACLLHAVRTRNFLLLVLSFFFETMAKEGARQGLFTKLLSIPGSIDLHGGSEAYMTDGRIGVNVEVVINLLHIRGIGEVHLPLSSEDLIQVRRVCAPFDGSAILVGGETRCAWQVDSFISSCPQGPLFPTKTARLIAAEAGKALGLHGIQVRAYLSNLLLCEHGNPLQFLCDMKEAQPGNATMLIPISLKMGFRGGVLVAAQGSRPFTFNFTWSKSHLSPHTTSFHTTFIADQKLQKVNSGLRLLYKAELYIQEFSFEGQHVL